jgi:hypothetical protein
VEREKKMCGTVMGFSYSRDPLRCMNGKLGQGRVCTVTGALLHTSRHCSYLVGTVHSICYCLGQVLFVI